MAALWATAKGGAVAARSWYGVVAAAVPGGGVAIATVVGLVAAAAMAPALLQRAPGPIRTLPGIDLVAGIPAPTFQGALYDIPAPLSVAASPAGDVVYVVEGKGDRYVRRIPLQEGEPSLMAPPGTEPGTRKPVSVAVGPDGMVYVVDRVRGDVDMYDAAGNWLGILPPAAERSKWQPLAVGTGPGGEVFVLNAAPDGPPLAEYDAQGWLVQVQPLLDAEGVKLSFPSGIGLSDDGEFVVADSNNARIVVFDPLTGIGRVAGVGVGDEQLAMPRGLAVDARGNVFVADATDHDVAVWDVGADPPRLLFRFGSPGFEDGEMLFPNGVALDGHGAIYVADRDNDRVQIWR